jgi:hypothetical protein
MRRYANAAGDSGVSHYEIGEDFIRIRFSGSSDVYEYNAKMSKRSHIEKMKDLARAGIGLSTYIAQHPDVRDHFKQIHAK